MSICKQAPGTFIPVIDANKCEGKGPCVEVCPYQVLDMHTMPKVARAELKLVGKLKGWVHGWEKAVVVQAERCLACGLCVSACPEQAITLARSTAS